MAPSHDLELVDLDDERARPELIGAKAGRLAEARRRGLPVLPGFVVLPAPGQSLVAELLPEVAHRGPHAVSLTLMERVPEELDLSAAVARGAHLGASLVARSSSHVEDDPVWSGAFSSYLELQPEQLVTAVAGCWASTLTPSVLELCERTGAEPPAVCPAVLVQPMVEPQASGTATFGGEASGAGGTGADGAAGAAGGAVEIVAVWGSPAPLMAGWAEGWRARVVGDEVSGPAVGEAPGSGAPGSRPAVRRGRPLDRPFPAEWLRGVAALAREACEGAASAIEWAVVDDRPVLLQARPVLERPQEASAGAGAAPSGAVAATGAGAGAVLGGGSSAPGRAGEGIAAEAALVPGAVRVARAAARYGGPLGDDLVLPWLLGMGPAAPVMPEPSVVTGAAEADQAAAMERFDRAVAAAEALVAQAMGRTLEEARPAAAALLGRVAGGDVAALGEARPVDAGPAAAVLRDLATTAGALVARGVLAHVEQLWSLSPDEVRRLLATGEAGDWHRHRHRTLRWQAFVQQVIAVRGRQVRGDGVSPGVAAGPARWLSASRDLRRVVPGDVVVLHRPSPQLAPALWVASGLVAESGSGAAHLIEVARSLRVPAVVAVGTLEVEEGEDLLLVDGDEEVASLLPGDVERDGGAGAGAADQASGGDRQA